MAKSRAEIQKAYRERKKQENRYLKKEADRQKKYRKQTADMNQANIMRKRDLDKLHCAKYRQKTRNRNRDLVEFEHNHQETTAGTVEDEPIPGTSMKSPQAVHQETNQASAS